MYQTAASTALLLIVSGTCFARTPTVAPLKVEQVSPEEDALLAQRYGKDYSPQTDAGKKDQAAAAKAPKSSALAHANGTVASGDPCPGPSWTAKAMCANDLRDKAAVANKFPWMDLIYAYDAKILQASSDADAKRIKKYELFAKLKVAEYEFQEAGVQRIQTAQAQLQAQQASQEEQARQQAQQQATQQAQLDALHAQQQALQAAQEQAEAAQRAAAWQGLFRGLSAAGAALQGPTPTTTNCYKVGFMVQCTTQ